MATPRRMLMDPNVDQFSSFGQKYVRDKYGNYMDTNYRTPMQNWRERYRSKFGRWPSPRQEAMWHVNNIPGARYGLASQADPYGGGTPPQRPLPPGLQEAISQTQANLGGPVSPGGLPGPGRRVFGQDRGLGVYRDARGNLNYKATGPSRSAGLTDRGTSGPAAPGPGGGLPDFWGIVNNAASYDARGMAPRRPMRPGVVE